MLMFWTEAADTEASELMRAEPFACRPATVQVIEHRQARIMAVGVEFRGTSKGLVQRRCPGRVPGDICQCATH